MALPNTDLTPILEKIIARSLLSLRTRASLFRIVNRDYDTDAQKFGDTINVPLYEAFDDEAVTPAATAPAPTAKTAETVPIVLDQWRQSPLFGLTDKEMREINAGESFLPGQISGAIEGLVRRGNAFVKGFYTRAYTIVGDTTNIPFSTGAGGVRSATNAMRALNENLAPALVPRFGVLSGASHAEAAALAQFAEVDKSGDMGVITEGELGRKYGINWLYDDVPVVHTAGDAAGMLVNDPGATLAIGAKAIPFDTMTGAFVDGDIITFAGHTQTYAVQGATSGASGILNIEPGLVAVPADNEAITNVYDSETYTVDLVFARSALALAIRPLILPPGSRRVTAQNTDPVSGVSLRLEFFDQFRQSGWSFDWLYGANLLRTGHLVRLIGPA